MRKSNSIADGRARYGGFGECDRCRTPHRTYTPNAEAKAKYKKTYTRKKYGLTDEEYLDLLEKQGNKCATCPREAHMLSKDLYIDHDHSCCAGRESCGECVRGLLCASCNFALGHVSDRIDVLLSMVEYLTAYKES